MTRDPDRWDWRRSAKPALLSKGRIRRDRAQRLQALLMLILLCIYLILFLLHPPNRTRHPLRAPPMPATRTAPTRR